MLKTVGRARVLAVQCAEQPDSDAGQSWQIIASASLGQFRAVLTQAKTNVELVSLDRVALDALGVMQGDLVRVAQLDVAQPEVAR